MTCSDSLQDIQKHQDWTGSMTMSPSGRFQVIEESGGREKLFSREGIQWRLGWGLLIAVAALMAIVLLVDVISIGNSAHTIERLSSRVELIAEKNSQMSTELNYSAGDITVCTEAVKMNLISANGAMTVQLTAPEAANMTFSASAETALGQSN